MSERKEVVITHEEPKKPTHTVESNLILEIEGDMVEIKLNQRDVYNDFNEDRVYMTMVEFDKIAEEVRKYRERQTEVETKIWKALGGVGAVKNE